MITLKSGKRKLEVSSSLFWDLGALRDGVCVRKKCVILKKVYLVKQCLNSFKL